MKYICALFMIYIIKIYAYNLLLCEMHFEIIDSVNFSRISLLMQNYFFLRIIKNNENFFTSICVCVYLEKNV